MGQGGKGEERDGDPSEGGGHDGTTIDSSLRRTGIARSKLNVTISPLKKFILRIAESQYQTWVGSG